MNKPIGWACNEQTCKNTKECFHVTNGIAKNTTGTARSTKGIANNTKGIANKDSAATEEPRLSYRAGTIYW